jgi:hypothetical protein
MWAVFPLKTCTTAELFSVFTVFPQFGNNLLPNWLLILG